MASASLPPAWFKLNSATALLTPGRWAKSLLVGLLKVRVKSLRVVGVDQAKPCARPVTS